jgi:hypothetical protein
VHLDEEEPSSSAAPGRGTLGLMLKVECCSVGPTAIGVRLACSTDCQGLAGQGGQTMMMPDVSQNRPLTGPISMHLRLGSKRQGRRPTAGACLQRPGSQVERLRSCRSCLCLHSCMMMMTSRLMYSRSVCLSGDLCPYICRYLDFWISGFLDFWISRCLAVCLSGCLSVWLSVCLSENVCSPFV